MGIRDAAHWARVVLTSTKAKLNSVQLGEAYMSDDYSADTSTTGTVEVGGSATGEIETARDRDWFAVELVAGRSYVIDVEGKDTDAGSLANPLLRRMRDPDGDAISGTRNDNGGTGRNAQLTFTATETDTYYVEARAFRLKTGTYTVKVTDDTPDLGDITDQEGEKSATGSLAGSTDAVSYWRFTLTDEMTVTLGLAELDADADLVLEDAAGNALHTSRESGTDDEQISARLDAGTYYIRVEAQESGANNFEVRYSVDDYSDAAAEAGSVAVGSSATGTLETVGDRDWFAVTLEAGETYRISLEGSPTGKGTLSDPRLAGVHDADGNLVSGSANDNGGTGNNSEILFYAEEAGTHYIAAGAGTTGTRTGTYELSVAQMDDDYAADPANTTGTIAVGGGKRGEIQFAGDEDWFAVELVAGKAYRVDLKGLDTFNGTLPDPFLRGIYDANGTLVPGTTGRDHPWGNRDVEVDFVAPASGTHYIAASTEGGEGTYWLSVTEMDDDYAAGTDTDASVAVDGTATGDVDYRNDRDWFAVELVAGELYRIEIRGESTDDGTLHDPEIGGVYDSDGNLIANTSNDDGGAGFNARLVFEATESGTHYIEAGGNRYDTGTYEVRVSKHTDDASADTDTEGTVAVDGGVTGELEISGDEDWFAVELVAGGLYRIDIQGSRTSWGTLSDPHLKGIYDANGDLISGTTNDNGGTGRNSRLVFNAEDTGTYYIAAGAGDSGKGTYRLSVSQDDYAGNTSTVGTVAVGGSVTGDIDFVHDRDWIAVELVAGETYRIDLEGSPTSQGTLSDPYLRGIYDADGDLISGTANDDGGSGRNSKVIFEATESGTYYVAAGAYGGTTGTYRLSIAEEAGDGL